jgi:hypothetical protein
VDVEAIENVRLFMNQGDMQLFRSTWSNDVRTDYQILNAGLDPLSGNTVISTLDNPIEFQAGDSNNTYVLGGFTISDSNNYTVFESTQPSGFMFKSAFNVERLLANSDMVVASNLYVGGHIMGHDLNVYKDIATDSNNEATRVGYAFRINARDQLELIKYSRFYNDLPDAQKKVAVFGMNDLLHNDANQTPEYTAFGDLTNVSFTNGQTGSKMFGSEDVPIDGGSITLDINQYPNAIIQLDEGATTLLIDVLPNPLTSAEVGTKGTITIIERSTIPRTCTCPVGFIFTSANAGTLTTAAPELGGYSIDVITYIVLSPTLVSATFENRTSVLAPVPV